jgi:NAD(P)-dependent dehydrogenase (short-subunit alcohol dehydrogenase family)
MKLDGSIAAVVTGGASGLGEGTARAIAATGARVALFDLNEERGEAIAAEIGGVFCKVDVTDDASVAAAFDKARAAHGQERLTVNCAGIATGMKTVSRKKDTGEIKAHDMAQFERTVRVNLFGTFRVLSQSAAGMAALEPMADGERGLIVNTASVAAQDGQIGQAAYAASKGGIVSMALPAAREFARFGIRVNTVAPGIFMTPLLHNLPEEAQQSLAAAIPYPSRLGDPAEFADAVRFIIENQYINGEVIRLDGAIRMQPK